MQYKLDQGIDHILLDEAQDTSPDQWEVVSGWRRSSSPATAAREVSRTMFAVGDEKQSIYSFQGAAPEAFAESRLAFSEPVRDAEARFEHVKLTWSFRSTDDVLDAVDRVFADPGARRGITRDPDPVEHKAIRTGAPGSVEVWPTLGAEAVEEPDDWTKPVDQASAPAVRVAETCGGDRSRAGSDRASSSRARGEAVRPARSWCWCASATASCTRCRAA